MRFATLLAIAAVIAAVALATKVEDAPHGNNLRVMFQAWMKKIGRVYASAEEEEKHFKTYAMNVQRLSKQQGKLLPLEKQNNMLDLTYEEFVKRYTFKGTNRTHPQVSVDSEKVVASTVSRNIVVGNYSREDGTLGATYQWAFVTPIKNQNQCGSCWAFSTCAALEGQWGAKWNRQPNSLSTQQLVSCFGGSCGGQWPQDVARWLVNKKLATWSLYPYVSGNGNVPRCNPPANPAVYVLEKSFTHTYPSNWQTQFTSSGPSAIVIYTCPSFQSYSGGIYNCDCGSNNDLHAMALYGYTDSYWIIKNSWDTTWGAQGWLYLRRGVNACGMGNYGQVQYTLY